MVATAITIGAYTFTFNPGDIESVKEDINTSLQNNKIATMGPMGNINYDTSGVGKTISIKGKLTEASTTRVAGYSITTILAQKQWLESILNGSQVNGTLTDDYVGQSVLSSSGGTPPFLASFTTTKFMSPSISFWRENGKPNQMNFEITMKVGTA